MFVKRIIESFIIKYLRSCEDWKFSKNGFWVQAGLNRYPIKTEEQIIKEYKIKESFNEKIVKGGVNNG